MSAEATLEDALTGEKVCWYVLKVGLIRDEDLRGDFEIGVALSRFCRVEIGRRDLVVRNESGGGREGVLVGEDVGGCVELVRRDTGALFAGGSRCLEAELDMGLAASVRGLRVGSGGAVVVLVRSVDLDSDSGRLDTCNGFLSMAGLSFDVSDVLEKPGRCKDRERVLSVRRATIDIMLAPWVSSSPS